jgi:type IV secretory pathway TraG/TraD family ATPase VirD4
MDNFTAEYISKMLGTATIEHLIHRNVSTTHDDFRQNIATSTTTSTQTMSRPLLHPDEVRGLGGDFCLIMGRFPPILSRRIVYHEDWDLLHCARPDPHFPRTENVRWRALQRRLGEMGSVARLLKEYGYEVQPIQVLLPPQLQSKSLPRSMPAAQAKRPLVQREYGLVQKLCRHRPQ